MASSELGRDESPEAVASGVGVRGRKPRPAQQEGGWRGPRRVVQETGAGNSCTATPPNCTLKKGSGVNFTLGVFYPKCVTLRGYVRTCVGRKLKRMHPAWSRLDLEGGDAAGRWKIASHSVSLRVV